MALSIEDPEIERRVREWSERSGWTPEEVVRQALDAQEARTKARYEEVMGFLASSKIEPGGRPMTKAEREGILGYGAEGF